MPRLRITVLDLVTKGPTRKLFARVMNPNFASIMPQAVAVWCEQLGHHVRYICYTGFEDLSRELLGEADVVFIGAFTRSAHAAYAISSLFRQHGAITVLGGPHARCYPEDAVQYFDYVLGFTDRATVDNVLHERAPRRSVGRYLSADQQPHELPGVQERWKFIEPTLAKAPLFQVVPMIGSMGCPYTCSFCIDSTVAYQPLATERIQEDLRFLLTKLRRPCVGWHDPLFGVRFDEYMTAIEEAVPPNRIDFIAEISLSLLSEPHLKRLKTNGFKGLLPGIESWYTLGNKSKTGHHIGEDKVRHVADHTNLILSYIPFVQTNFILGLDCDEGPEPFDLTKYFLDLAPGAFPAFSLFTAYGQAAPLNLELQRAQRVAPLPFYFLDSHFMNVRPKHYSWADLYALSADVARYALSWTQMGRRFHHNRGLVPKCINAIRTWSSGRIKRQTMMAHWLETDRSFRRFFEGETTDLPPYFKSRIRTSLGTLWEALPPGGLMHDPNAYLHGSRSSA